MDCNWRHVHQPVLPNKRHQHIPQPKGKWICIPTQVKSDPDCATSTSHFTHLWICRGTSLLPWESHDWWWNESRLLLDWPITKKCHVRWAHFQCSCIAPGDKMLLHVMNRVGLVTWRTEHNNRAQHFWACLSNYVVMGSDCSNNHGCGSNRNWSKYLLRKHANLSSSLHDAAFSR